MILINNVDCGVSKKGTGLIDCTQTLGKPNGFILVDNNWELDVSTGTFDLTYINDQIKSGNFVPFVNAIDFADNSEETVFETYSSGVKAKVRDGLAEFDFTFINGYHWHASAYSHNGYGDKAVVMIWENGVLGFDRSSDGSKIRGLKRGYFDVKTFRNNDGSARSKTMAGMQLLNTKNYNSNMALLNEDTLGFSIGDINGAVDSNVVLTAVPSVGDTTVSVKVTPSANQAIAVAGLTEADFTVTGQTVNSVTYNASTNTYDITTDAFVAGAGKVVSLGTGTDIAVEVAGVLYSGASAEFTVS